MLIDKVLWAYRLADCNKQGIAEIKRYTNITGGI